MKKLKKCSHSFIITPLSDKGDAVLEKHEKTTKMQLLGVFAQRDTVSGSFSSKPCTDTRKQRQFRGHVEEEERKQHRASRRSRGLELGREQRNQRRGEEEDDHAVAAEKRREIPDRSCRATGARRSMDAAMDLMRRMPPGSAETALNALLSLLPDHSLDLLSQIDLPLQVCMDKESMKEYILCEYNRDADSYRSPWSNKYEPPLEDGTVPSEAMRNLEIEANEVFSVYRDQYYEGGISSVYIWEDEDNGFIACFLIKKDGQGKRGYMQIGSWDAIHVIQVGPEEEGAAHYCLNSTVMLSLTTDNKQSGTFNLSGSIRRQMSMTLAVADGHLVNMGKMIEEMEGKLRNSLDQVYFGKTREMVCTLRPPPEVLNMRLPDS